AENFRQSTGLRSREVGVAYEPKGPPPAEPKVWAVVVGTSDYDGEGLKLRYAAKDAQDFAKALEVGARGLWPNDLAKRLDIRLLTKAASDGAKPDDLLPSADNIRKALERVEKNASLADVLIVYFSGHGMTVRGKGADGKDSDEYVYATWQVTR